jgi:hypothetical protein
MATAVRHSHKQENGLLKDAPRHITKTLDATVTEKPSRPEMAFDLLLVTAAALEAISPPAAIAGMVLNRVVHAAK